MIPISDSELADVEAIIARGLAIPAILVKAIIGRLRNSERQLSLHAESLRCWAEDRGAASPDGSSVSTSTPHAALARSSA